MKFKFKCLFFSFYGYLFENWNCYLNFYSRNRNLCRAMMNRWGGGVFTAWEANMNHPNCGFAILKESMCKGCLKSVLTGGFQWDQHLEEVSIVPLMTTGPFAGMIKNKLLNGEPNNINALFQKINTSGSTYGAKQSLPVQRSVERFKRNDVCNSCRAKQRQV